MAARRPGVRWLYSEHERTGAWFIVPMSGSMRGFTSYEHEFNVQVPGVELSPDNMTIYQALNGGQILPGQEYILWFEGPSGPVTLQTAMRLSPTGTFGDDESIAAMTKALGIQRKYPEFSPTPEGMLAAFSAARQLVARKAQTSAAFTSALRSVADALPQIKESSATRTVWNQPSSSSSHQFVAAKFRSTQRSAAGLSLVFVTDGELPRWGVLETGGGIPAAGDHYVRASVAADGTDLPADLLGVAWLASLLVNHEQLSTRRVQCQSEKLDPGFGQAEAPLALLRLNDVRQLQAAQSET